MNDNIKSSLMLETLFFDKIEFDRKGMKTSNEIEFEISVSIAQIESEKYSIRITLTADKVDEYEAKLELVGIFTFSDKAEYDQELKKKLITQNTVSIMMPYLRSQLTILTSQPNLDPVIMPIMNVSNMFKNKEL